MRRLIAQLRTARRRARHCRIGDHRETVESAFGILQLRCVDCGAHRALGWVFLGVSNRKPHPWEERDA